MTSLKSLSRIGVLAGGPSSEREISLRSGRAVHHALIAEGCDAVFLDVWDDIRDAIRAHPIDVAFIALHGRFGEDGTVQKILDDVGIPYTGSGVEASRLALDKVASKERFMRKGIPTPRFLAQAKDDPKPDIEKELSLPVVVKPRHEGSSIGLTVVRDAELLDDALVRAFACEDEVLVEEYIEGKELTVGILADKALPVIEIVTRNNLYDYDAKYRNTDTAYLVPAPVESSVYNAAQAMSLAAHEALGCRFFSRVDLMVDRVGGLSVL